MLHRGAHASVPGPQPVSMSAPGWPRSLPSPGPVTGVPSVPGLHRAIRLALAAGVGAAGVCLVLGMTVLAVTVGTSGAGPAIPDAAGRVVQPVSKDSTPARPASSSAGGSARREHATLPLVGRTVAYFHGSDQPSRAAFRIPEPGTWGLSWVLRCQGGKTGHLIVTEGTSASPNDVGVEASGRSDGGTSWYVRDPGRHWIAIRSSCSWSVAIVLTKAAAGG